MGVSARLALLMAAVVIAAYGLSSEVSAKSKVKDKVETVSLKPLKGKIILSDAEISTENLGENFVTQLQKINKTKISARGEAWNLFFLAFFQSDIGPGEIHIAFFDVTDGKREFVNTFPYELAGKSSSLAGGGNPIILESSGGFKADKTYMLEMGPLVNGKMPKKAATATVTLTQ